MGHHAGILQDVSSGENVDVVYLDFAEAFNKIDHGVLLHMISVGITGKFGIRLHGFLTNRKLRVEAAHSGITTATSGVPQGSVLGPLLFLIVMRDIDQMVTSS
uniref:Reverse transcriptase domain-containing protein n=1 Tax=Scylla olivacea TaxID=85551 RepID=A0A0P4W681_SCYOL